MKKMIGPIVVLILLIVGVLAVIMNSENTSDEKKVVVNDTQENNIQEGRVENNVVLAGGAYIEYSESALANASGNNVLFFHADWCPVCVSIEKEIKEKGLPDDISVLKIDYDNSTDLKKKYSITSQSTLVLVDSEGNMIEKWMGGGLDGIIKNVEAKGMKKSSMEDVVENEVVLANGEYVEYSETALANAQENKILFFHADWCPVCVATEKEINEKGLPDGVSILKVDYDNSKDLKQKYGVVSQTTFVMVDGEGNMIKKWLGGGVDGIIESIN